VTNRVSKPAPPLGPELLTLLQHQHATDLDLGRWLRANGWRVHQAVAEADEDWDPTLLEHVARTLCRHSIHGGDWRVPPDPYVSKNNHWYGTAAWVLRAVSHWLPRLREFRGSGSGEQHGSAPGGGGA